MDVENADLHLFEVGGVSVRATWVSQDVGTAETSLEKPEIGLIHILVAVEVGPFATDPGWTMPDAGQANLEQAEIGLIHITIDIEIAWYRGRTTERVDVDTGDRPRTGIARVPQAVIIRIQLQRISLQGTDIAAVQDPVVIIVLIAVIDVRIAVRVGFTLVRDGVCISVFTGTGAEVHEIRLLIQIAVEGFIRSHVDRRVENARDVVVVER